MQGFLGSTVVKNLSCSSIPGLGGSHMLQSNKVRASQLRSPRAWSACSTTREATAMRSPHTATRE